MLRLRPPPSQGSTQMRRFDWGESFSVAATLSGFLTIVRRGQAERMPSSGSSQSAPRREQGYGLPAPCFGFRGYDFQFVVDHKIRVFEYYYSDMLRWFKPTRTRHRQHDSILYADRYTCCFKNALSFPFQHPCIQNKPNPHILLEFPVPPASPKHALPAITNTPSYSNNFSRNTTSSTSLPIFENLTHATDPATGFADSQAHRFCSITPSGSARLCRASALLLLSRLCKRPSCSA